MLIISNVKISSFGAEFMNFTIDNAEIPTVDDVVIKTFKPILMEIKAKLIFYFWSNFRTSPRV